MKGFSGNLKRATLIAHLCFLVLIVVPFIFFGTQLDAWIPELLKGEQDAVVIALAIVWLALDVFLPIPSSFVNMTATLYLGPLVGFLVVFLGLSISCWLGYGFGYYFRKALFDRFYEDDDFRQLTFDLTRYGFITLVVARGMPVIAELSVMAAGYHRYPLNKFLFATFVSNAALAGIYAGFVSMVGTVDSLLFLGFTLIAVPAIAIGVRYCWVLLRQQPAQD